MMFGKKYFEKRKSFPCMKSLSKFFIIIFLFVSDHFVVAGDCYMFGTLDRMSPIFKPGEDIVFNLTLFDENGNAVKDKKIHWQRTGDDGIKQEGNGISSEDGFKITTSINKPGFVRIYAEAFDENGKQIMGVVNGKTRPVFFDGGACVAPEALEGLPEPVDFDSFWEKQKKELAAIPMKILERKKVEENEKVNVYDIKISCAGKAPVSGYLVMPKNASPESLPAEVKFSSYGVFGASYNMKTAGNDKIYFHVNAHGIENGKNNEYYETLEKTSLKNYAFNAEENSNTETIYFNGMFMRVMRALQYVKSIPEWNRKDLRVIGGSQGGLQSLAAAGLDKDVTSCYAWAPWCCDLGRTKLNRMVGPWYIKYTPALEYFDPINLIKRANPRCELFIIANMGDYVCPPSGVWIAYNNFPGPKKIEIRQGCQHGFEMKNFPVFTICSGKK